MKDIHEGRNDYIERKSKTNNNHNDPNDDIGKTNTIIGDGYNINVKNNNINDECK